MKQFNSDSFMNYSKTEKITTDLWSISESIANKFALFNSKGKQLTYFKYEFIGKFPELPNNILLVGEYDKNGLSYGCINQNGKEILPSVYKSIDDIFDIFCINNKI